MNRILLAATLALAAVPALATPHGPGQPLPSWKCARLNATEAQLRDPQWRGVAILAEPDPAAQRLGVASALPFIADPPVERGSGPAHDPIGWLPGRSGVRQPSAAAHSLPVRPRPLDERVGAGPASGGHPLRSRAQTKETQA